MKVGRNDPCPCDSGKKYKQCCALKGHKRARFYDSAARGLFYLFGPIAIALIAAFALGALRGGATGDDGLERVWSAAHAHWHVILPDGSETELRPGMVWDPEHGHFHQVAAQATADASRRHITSKLDQRMLEIDDSGAQEQGGSQ